MSYLRKGQKEGSDDLTRDYIPFTDEEFRRAKALLDQYPDFSKVEEGFYVADNEGSIQFSDVVNRQVHIGSSLEDRQHPVIRKLIEILQPQFYLSDDEVDETGTLIRFPIGLFGPLETLKHLRDECLSEGGLREPLRNHVIENYENARWHLRTIYEKGFSITDDFFPEREAYRQNGDYRYLYNHFMNHVYEIRRVLRINPKKRQ